MRSKIVEVVWTQDRRGDGSPNDPVRLVPQLWSKDGELIAEAEYGIAKAFQGEMNKLGER